MTDIGPLSEEEQALILDRRREQARKASAHEFRLKSLETAARYGRWLDDHGRDDSFSTFVNEFGYQAADLKAMYETVRVLLTDDLVTL